MAASTSTRYLVLLFALALVPRLWALGWGLPYVEHPDEPAVLEVAMRMVQQGDFNPGMFLYPSLFFYALALVIRLYLVWSNLTGLSITAADLPSETYLFTTAPALYYWARALTATLGAASVPLLYELGRRMFNARVGLLAAMALAVSSYHVEHSHFVTTDVPSGLWVVLALLGAWRVAHDGGWRGYLLGGLATGLAAGTKYNAGVIGLALAAATAVYLLDARRTRPLLGNQGALVRQQFERLVAAAALALLVFLLTTPYALLDWQAFRRAMQINAAHYASGSHGDFTGRWRLDGYLGFLWAEGLLPTGLLLLVAGLPALVRNAPRQLALLLVAVLACGGLLLTQAVNFNRNTLAFLPVLFLLAAAGTVTLADWLGTRSARFSGVEGAQLIDIRPNGPPGPGAAQRLTIARRVANGVVLLLGAALLVPQLLDSLWLLRYWSQPHTLVAAANLLRAQPRGMLAAVEANPVQWASDPVVEPLSWLGEHDPAWYRARGYRYLLLNAERYRPEEQPAYQQLLAGGTLLHAWPARRQGLQPGPGVALLDLGEDLATIPFTRRAANFGGVVQLLGYELRPGEPRARVTPLEGANAPELAPGQPAQINLYWRALAGTEVDYTLFLHLYDAAGQRVAQRDLPLRYDDYPTSRWRPGELVLDRADFVLPALTPDAYRLELGLYNAATGAPLPAESGAPVVLATIQVR